jgi:uncharacterized protein YdaU (DUF1376 family)
MAEAMKMHREAISRVDFYFDDFLTGTDVLTAEEVGIYMLLLSRMWSQRGPLVNDNKQLAKWCNVPPQRMRKTLSSLIEKEKIHVDEGGALFNPRALLELENAMSRKQKAADRGRLGGARKAANRQEVATKLEESSNNVATKLKLLGSDPEQNLEESLNLFEQEPQETAGLSLAGLVAQVDRPCLAKGVATSTSTLKKDISVEEGFEEWWSQVRRKVKKQGCEKAYLRIIKKHEATPEQLLKAIKIYHVSVKDSEDQFVSTPMTWLNGARWEDEVSQPSGQTNNPLSASPDQWRGRMRAYQDKGIWTEAWGPKPGQAGCMVPAEISQSIDVSREVA